MRKMISIRNGVIVALCGAIILMAVGFSVLAFRLKSLSDKTERFDVSFVKVSRDQVHKGGKTEPQGDLQIKSHGKKLEMNFTLYEVQDEMNFTAIVKNRGTIPARIVEVVATPDYKDKRFGNLIAPVKITYDEIAGRELDSQEEVELKISVLYPKSNMAGARNVSCKLGIISESVSD